MFISVFDGSNPDLNKLEPNLLSFMDSNHSWGSIDRIPLFKVIFFAKALIFFMFNQINKMGNNKMTSKDLTTHIKDIKK